MNKKSANTVTLGSPEEKRAFHAWCWIRGIKVRANAVQVDAGVYKKFRKNESVKAGYASQN